MKIVFYKYQGTGNDFVIIDNRELIFPKENHALIHQLCDRKFGIGADGLMLLENTPDSDFRMVYYNADGNESTMCGNGGRCISAFAYTLGVTQEKGNFIAIDGLHQFEINNDIVRLQMIDVKEIKQDSIVADDYVLFTGSPHYVSFRSDIDKLDIISEAHKIRYNETFSKEGINVNFVQADNGKVQMRTYERGVEDETLSCGTGTVAVALCFATQNQLEKGTVDIQTPGGQLAVSFVLKNNTFTEVWLEGAAKQVFEGTIQI
ncbi:MAG TPA: diaminopimelate epimerase [Chitinophagales bacterium]|jgi:diaminopimelate epimerase|nr:diaminopimelate epimerase [Chitinophagales bacterium]